MVLLAELVPVNKGSHTVFSVSVYFLFLPGTLCQCGTHCLQFETLPQESRGAGGGGGGEDSLLEFLEAFRQSSEVFNFRQSVKSERPLT